MRVLRYLAILGILLFPATYASHAEIHIGIGIGGPVYAPPVCPYGYYGYAPYACAPYGYYGPAWFANGVFIGAGPWYHRPWGWRPYYRPYRAWGDYGPGYYYHHHDDDDDDDQGYWRHHGDWDHDGYRHDHGEHRGWYKHDR